MNNDTYIDPRDNRVVVIKDEPLQKLIGLARFLQRKQTGDGWIKLNGQEKVAIVCRAIRAKLFRCREVPHGSLRACLNFLDPPNCRCGRKGTRMIGGETFCAACGPSKEAAGRLRWRQNLYEVRGKAVDAENKSFDDRQKADISLHATAKAKRRV